MYRVLRIALPLTVLTAFGLLLAACGTTAQVGSPPASSPTAMPAQSAPLAAALRSMTTSAFAWSFEPSGDVPAPRGTAGTLVFAAVHPASGSTASVAFDARQLYIGPPADVATRRDGLPPASDTSGAYSPDRYRHREVLPLAQDCAIVLLDSSAPGGMRAVDGAHFAQALRAAGSGGLYCWLVVGKGEVLTIVQQLVAG